MGTRAVMVSLAQLAVFVPAAALVAISPGANNLLAMRNGMRVGFRGAVVALGGRVVGFTVMLTLAAAGAASVLVTSQTAFTGLKWAGVAYLAFLGLRGLRASPAAPASR